jgi:phosphatidate phosphatase PAH1
MLKMNPKSRASFFSCILILSCVLSFHFSLAQSKEKKEVKGADSLESVENFLQFTCKVTTQNKLLNPIDVILYSNNKVIDHQILDKKLKFEYFLKKDSSYILQVSAPFYITRYVIIDTHMPKKTQGRELLYVHDMNMELMEQPKVYYTPEVNSDILDEPITIIRYITQQDMFNTDPRYTRKMKRELRMFKKSIEKLKEG